jgi:hypothetical protein
MYPGTALARAVRNVTGDEPVESLGALGTPAQQIA